MKLCSILVDETTEGERPIVCVYVKYLYSYGKPASVFYGVNFVLHCMITCKYHGTRDTNCE